MKLPDALVGASREGRLVLFLGAGASLGAKNSFGEDIPDGSTLTKLIVENYLKPNYLGRDLKTVYDLACSRRDTRTLQRFLYDTLEDFQPTEAHRKLSQLAWHGLATTNYDLLVERSFDPHALVPVVRDGGIRLDAIPSDKIVYLKLHGCVTQHLDIEAPLITSTEQIIDHRNHRVNIFKTFEEWGQNNPIAIVGYGMADDDLRRLFYDLIQERDGRPRHYIIRPGWDEIEADYWRERRFEPIDATFAEFVDALLKAVPPGVAGLGKMAREMRTTSLSRFISKSGARESDRLIDAISTVFDHVTSEVGGDGSPKLFYAGVNQGWYPIERGLDARRSAGSDALKRFVIQAKPKQGPSLVLLRGHAGSGKSVALRRLAWDAANSYDCLALYLREGQKIDVEALDEINSLVSTQIYLFVDDIGEHINDVRYILDRGSVRKWKLTLVGAERLNEWNALEQEFGIAPDDYVTLNYLSESEIVELVLLLEHHQSLGDLENYEPNDRVKRLSEYAGRQLLVALHEATRGGSFEDILEDEYHGIPSAEAKVLYLDICALHRFGPPVRAGLISRIHGISFAEFHERLFKPLEHVVIVPEEMYRGDYVYQARHNYIAEIVFNKIAKSQAHKQEVLLRILSKLNMEYSYDEVVLYQLISGRAIAELIPDHRLGSSVYEAAARSVGRTSRLLQQWAIYETRRAGDRGGLERAGRMLQEALELAPHSRSIMHSLAELALRRSDLARSDLEAATLRGEAKRIATNLAKKSDTSYPHHTLAKVAIANLQQALKEEAAAPSNLSTQAVNHALQEAESAIRQGLSRFPNDPYLLNSEAELGSTLKNADRALAALRKAFANDAKSELTANRLAKLLIAKSEFQEAAAVLTKAIAANPGRPLLHATYAKLLMISEPGADLLEPEKLLYHLRRARQEGKDNAESQLLYGRQLILAGEETEAKEVFEDIRRKKLAKHIPIEGGWKVLNRDGTNRVFYGTVLYVEDTHGYIDLEALRTRVYFHSDAPLFEGRLSRGMRVRFHLAFNGYGAIASDMAVE